jgi:hypothetical protein
MPACKADAQPPPLRPRVGVSPPVLVGHICSIICVLLVLSFAEVRGEDDWTALPAPVQARTPAPRL